MYPLSHSSWIVAPERTRPCLPVAVVMELRGISYGRANVSYSLPPIVDGVPRRARGPMA